MYGKVFKATFGEARELLDLKNKMINVGGEK